MKKILILAAALLLPAFIAANAVENEYYLLNVKGIIDAAHSDYIVTGIEKAEAEGAAGVVVKIDTPGGLMKSMRKIVDKILASKIPVITYVGPKGARAASAGTFILMASHVAVMAETTNIGTASPIDMKGNKAEEKITNDSIAYIKNLARLRGRNLKWAEECITKNISSSEKEALKLNVIDFIAEDNAVLMEKLNKREIMMGKSSIKISTEDYRLTPVPLSPRHKFLHYLTDPNVAYILFLVGTYGLIYELANPGVLFPGVAGAISLVLAFIGFESIPINIAGIVLIILALALLMAEAFTPTFGALTAGGVISLTVGSILLFPARGLGEAWAPSYWVIGTMVGLTTLLIGFVIMAVFRALRKKRMTGGDSLLGVKGTAVTDIHEKGVVNIGGEEWQGYSDEVIKAREVVEVTGVDGMKLKVKKIPRKKEE